MKFVPMSLCNKISRNLSVIGYISLVFENTAHGVLIFIFSILHKNQTIEKLIVGDRKRTFTHRA